jgi:hypothetical protein
MTAFARAATVQTCVRRRPGRSSSGTRVQTTPDPFATSIAATRSQARSCSSSGTSRGSSTPGTSLYARACKTGSGLPGDPGRNGNLTGVLTATMRDPSRVGSQRQAFVRTQLPECGRLCDGQPASVSAPLPARSTGPATQRQRPQPPRDPHQRGIFAPRATPPTGTDGFRDGLPESAARLSGSSRYPRQYSCRPPSASADGGQTSIPSRLSRRVIASADPASAASRFPAESVLEKRRAEAPQTAPISAIRRIPWWPRAGSLPTGCTASRPRPRTGSATCRGWGRSRRANTRIGSPALSRYVRNSTIIGGPAGMSKGVASSGETGRIESTQRVFR